MSARTCKGAGGGIHACYWHSGLELHPLPSSLKSCNWKPTSCVWQCPDTPLLHRNDSPKSPTASCLSGPMFFPHLPRLCVITHGWLQEMDSGTLAPCIPSLLPSCHHGPQCSHPCPPPPALEHSFVLGESAVGGSHTAYQPPPRRRMPWCLLSSPLLTLLSSPPTHNPPGLASHAFIHTHWATVCSALTVNTFLPSQMKIVYRLSGLKSMIHLHYNAQIQPTLQSTKKKVKNPITQI